MGFHSAGYVDGISPHVVDEFLRADYTRHNGPAMNADAYLQVELKFACRLLDALAKGKGRAGGIGGMAGCVFCFGFFLCIDLMSSSVMSVVPESLLSSNNSFNLLETSTE